MSGPRAPRSDRDQVISVTVVRDGELYLAEFIHYHLRKGVDHLVFVDTGSSDRTREIASSYDRVTLFTTDVGYRGYGLPLKLFLAFRVAADGWTLLLDIDEFFDFPYGDQVGLGSLIAYLNENSYSAVLAQMLDMFGPRPIGSVQDSGSVRDSYPLYDITSMKSRPYPGGYGNVLPNVPLEVHVGGIRTAVFGAKGFRLYKHPLLLTAGRVGLRDGHQVKNARIADVTGVLFHYKFTSRFPDQVREAVASEQYSHRSHAYKQFQKVLERNPELTMETPYARQLHHTDDLLDAGLLTASDTFLSWIRCREHDSRT